MKKIERTLASLQGFSLSPEKRQEISLKIAMQLHLAISKERSYYDRRRERTLGKIMRDEKARFFLTQLTDISFRSDNCTKVAQIINDLIDTIGIPRCLAPLTLFRALSPIYPRFFLNLLRKKILARSADFVIFDHAYQPSAQTLNYNYLGEALLGEEEALQRIERYKEMLSHPHVHYISVKVSTLYSQICLINWDRTLEVLSDRLRTLYRAAGPDKCVNLDMEESSYVDLTVTLFKHVLGEPEFLHQKAGIVLQSYLPQSFAIQKKLTAWAKKRGGRPLRLRIVKGANLLIERQESSEMSWQQAPFNTKTESDANFKRMVTFGLDPEHCRWLHIGVASHNLFDIAYALVLMSEHPVAAQFEMLRGMSPPMQRVIEKLTGQLTLYTPSVETAHFDNALAYLMRRLDESGSEENFLHDSFDLSLNTSSWWRQQSRFTAAFQAIDHLPEAARKNSPLTEIKHSPTTDLSLKRNRDYAHNIYQIAPHMEKIPLVIDGKRITGNWGEGIDPSNPMKPLYLFSNGTTHQTGQVVQAAKQCITKIDPKSIEKGAELLQERRAKITHTLMSDGGKTFHEADAEVSEAIDFMRYYPARLQELKESPIAFSPKGVVVVAPPWNFPLAIAMSGVIGALLMGNSVILKPAPETVLVGWTLATTLWEAGVSTSALHFFPCKDEEGGTALIKHPDVAMVVLTGATETAHTLLQLRPHLDLKAETGGKNALIISALSDHDLAIKDLLFSAFSHGGQKCSACSLCILDRELYNNNTFLQQLKDAAQSYLVGSQWDPNTKIPPLMRPIDGPLKQGIDCLEPGESWLLHPHLDPDNPHLMTPGIKLGVAKGSFMHQTELFGPLLSIMCAENLEEAIDLANSTHYGLTAGLHSLDRQEQELWKTAIIAGNLYINRTMTGAIVERQPFGGCKASSFGDHIKAGGPNSLLSFAHIREREGEHDKEALPHNLMPLIEKLPHYLSDAEQKVWIESVHDYAAAAKLMRTPRELDMIQGQENLYYFVPKERVTIRLEQHVNWLDLLRVIAACFICETPFHISSKHALDYPDVVVEKEVAAVEHVRHLDVPVLSYGLFELVHYMREVSLSHTFHRYGYTKRLEDF